MLLEIVFIIFIGIFFGIITGLIPGIHVNLIGILLISIYSIINIDAIYFIVLITSMSITHTFVDFIPSVFLGCPDTDTELSILPGHKLLKKGKGYEAILLTNYGSLVAIFILVLVLIPSLIFISKIQNLIQNLIPYILIITSIILLSIEKRKIKALFIFILTGLLGLCILNLEINQPLLPLLTGLFGVSNLLISIKNKTKIPEQKITKIYKKKIKPLIGALIASPLCSFLPGLGSGQAAIIGNIFTKIHLPCFARPIRNGDHKDFLILLGATNTLVMGFSFLTLYTISKTRTGSAFAISQIANNLSPQILILILITIIISGIISFFTTKQLAKIISTKIHKVNYAKISIATLIILTIITILISGISGLFVLIISTLTGIYCISSKVRRTNMMGCLIIPTIILYLF
ncbi:MAG: tripartite tricarboxylate transporter permease [Nanoarchaeota archaeon]